MKKKRLNRKRKRCCSSKESTAIEQSEHRGQKSEGDRDDSTLISYLGSLVGLLEDRPVSPEEVVEFIKEVRQQGMEKQESSGYFDKGDRLQPP